MESKEEECEKHKGHQLNKFCESCKTLICENCKPEHVPKHVVYTLEEFGQKLIQQLCKEKDAALFEEICKLDAELSSEVKKLKTWFENIQKKVIESIHQCMNEVMNEVLEQTNEKLRQKKVQMEEIMKAGNEEKEKVVAEIKDLIAGSKFSEIYKYKDLYFQCIENNRFIASMASSKGMWIQHIKKIKDISTESLKGIVSSSLNHIFYVPLLYIIPNKSDQIMIYDPATKSRRVFTMEGIQKTKHFDSLLIRNSIFITGGQDDENKTLSKNVFEYELLETGNILSQKADMLKGRFGHKNISVIDSFIYSLGGVTGSLLGTKYTNHCEKYDRVYDRWVEVKPLHENKGYMSACQFKERFIYVFGGFSDDVASESSSIVELLDTMIESEGWKIVKFTNVNKKWAPISQAGVFQIGKQMLLLFGGRSSKSQFSADCFIFNIKDNTMKQLECKTAHATSFYQRSIVTYKDELYSFDATENNLHIFEPLGIKWKVIKRSEWDHS